MGVDIYKPEQAKVLFDVWPERAETFIVAGTADGYEAQTIKEEYDWVNCIGFEPNEELYKKQKEELMFPGTLYPCALWHNCRELKLATPHHANGENNPRSSSLVRDFSNPKYATNYKTISATTLDIEESINGPWNNIVLWLDVECSEIQVLGGCIRLFEEDKILMVNVEVFYEHELSNVENFFNIFGFEEVKRWNTGGMLEVGEIIYKRKDLL